MRKNFIKLNFFMFSLFASMVLWCHARRPLPSIRIQEIAIIRKTFPATLSCESWDLGGKQTGRKLVQMSHIGLYFSSATNCSWFLRFGLQPQKHAFQILMLTALSIHACLAVAPHNPGNILVCLQLLWQTSSEEQRNPRCTASCVPNRGVWVVEHW